METVDYNNKKLRLICAFVASIYILFHGRPINLVKALSSFGFYMALAVSFAIALLLVYTIHTVTLWLDKRYDWRSMPLVRAVMQFAFAVVVPALIDLMLISVYFHSLEQSIVENGFLLIDFPVIVAFIIFLNLYYLIQYLLLTEAKPTTMPEYSRENDGDLGQNPVQSETSKLTIHYNGQHLQFDVVQEVLYFYRSGKVVKLFTIHGNEYATNLSIAVLEKRFHSEDFYRINRSLIVNCSAILGYVTGEKRDSYTLIFKPQFHELVTSKDKKFYITKEYLPLFRERFGTL
ncbi:LytTr DNA-binding domain-containing protein [Chryseobacterium sp. 52]|uniref:LytTR family DNA-binding domain-containing protein n=1 Tax=Chryseobacterium sp. 52 TaxID=2035213 RepID=UPI000C19A61B|nr:LytTR family DNA-binding domain-containing protein [Chryseobacterium sp. 52]PIF45353.1 LytTr DNA-binding domain-containing protein [Chryseobacterium sp. 52]